MLGAALGFGMIVMHMGPGIIPPAKPDTPEQRNQAREQDLDSIAQALVQYEKNHNHKLPIKLGAGSTEICTSIGTDCATSHKVDLGFLVNDGELQVIPRDPSGSNQEWSSGYLIAQLPDGTFHLNAMKAELGRTIQITR